MAAAPGDPGRNDPCPCGSGRKFKRCHGVPAGGQGDRAQALAEAALERIGADDPLSAERFAREALALAPSNADALNVLAIAACRRRDFPSALASVDRAIRTAPAAAPLHMNRGNILREAGRPVEAMAALRRALQLDPALEAAWFNLGLAATDAGDEALAVDAFERCTAEAAEPATRLRAVADRLRHLRRFDAMANVLRRALALAPDDHRVRNDLGMALLELADPLAAEAMLRQAIALRPREALLHRNLGSALAELGRFAEAEGEARSALEVEQSHEAWCLLGAARAGQRRFAEADEAFERARAIAPDDALTAVRHGMLLLANGHVARGLALLERRLDDAAILPWRRLAGIPRWRGEPIEGRTLLVIGEQGQGDCLQFVRHVPALRALGATVVLVVPVSLRRLLGTVDGVARVLAPEDAYPPCDFHVPMMSLPHELMRAGVDTQAAVPYLKVDGRVAARFASLPPAPGLLRVGLCWAGNPEYGTDRRRSIPAHLLHVLCGVPAVRWFSLQKSPAGFPAPVPPAGLAMQDLTATLVDFADTAALVRALDLVIAVDTSVAHLAGGLGAPVWLLNRFDTDWRWGWTGERTPWYPTMRIFRQPVPGDWGCVLALVRDALTRHAAAAPVAPP
jgi:Tfp pilus assembly protein PilF